MSFYNEIQNFKTNHLSFQTTPNRIEQIIQKMELTVEDFRQLLAPEAAEMLEEMAKKAHRLTIQHFGRTILLYTPLYLANYCVNRCVYCGFNISNRIQRKKLTLAEVEREASEIAKTGLKHILILTGESREQSSVSYIKDCVLILKNYFSSIAIEIYPLNSKEYHELIETGVDGLTIYQEVYNEKAYANLHLQGPKRDYRFRLEAPERAAEVGMRSVNIGALLGLDDWRNEAFFTGVHAYYLQKKFPWLELSVSFPRLRPEWGGFTPLSVVTDRDLVQLIVAFRLFLPRVGITISTRENSELRDNLIRLGVTKMSAGSSTVVGGHINPENGVGQFEISDRRSVAEIKEAVTRQGYKAIYKDWHCLE